MAQAAWVDFGSARSGAGAAIDWSLGKRILDRLEESAGLRVRTRLDLDLSGNPGMDPQHFRRRMLVLEKASS